MGAKTIRPSDVLIEQALVRDGALPARFEGDSLDFLRAAMAGKFWPSREQLYAARAILPIEHPAPQYANGLTVEEIERQAIERYIEGQSHEDYAERLIAQVNQLRANMSMRVRIEEAFKREASEADYTEEQLVVIGEILDMVEEYFPEERSIGEIIEPPPVRPTVRRRVDPGVIDVEAEDVSAMEPRNAGLRGPYGV